jgi:TolB-like protein
VKTLLAELKRRRVYRVGVVYAAAAFVIWQAAEIAFPALRLPDWLLTAVVVLTLIGFPIALILAWAFDITPEGVRRAGPVESGAAPTKHRWPLVATLAIVMLVVLGGAFWWARPRILGPVNPDAQVIAVLPFNTSGPGVELLGEGMVDLFSTNLNDVGGIRTVDSRTVMHRWQQRAADGILDLEGALALGRDVDAGSILLGSVVSTGPEVRMTAELYSVRGGELARAQVDGPADSVLALVDGLGIDLLREIWLAREPLPHLRVSAITTTSVDAIRAYLDGMQHYRRSEWDSAIAAFQTALEEDSTFALAHHKLASSYGWSGRHGPGSRETLFHGEAALRHAHRLPTRERTLMASHLLYEQSRPEALDTLEAYVTSYPDDLEGRFLLADVRFHMQHIRGFALETLYAGFEQVLELDRSLTPAVFHLLQLSLAYNDSARYYRYLDAYEEGTRASELLAHPGHVRIGPADAPCLARVRRFRRRDDRVAGRFRRFCGLPTLLEGRDSFQPRAAGRSQAVVRQPAGGRAAARQNLPPPTGLCGACRLVLRGRSAGAHREPPRGSDTSPVLRLPPHALRPEPR